VETRFVASLYPWLPQSSRDFLLPLDSYYFASSKSFASSRRIFTEVVFNSHTVLLLVQRWSWRMADFIVPSTSQALSDTRRRLDGPIHAERHVRIICVGAGASGLLLAYKLQRHFRNYSLTIYEKNAQVSGTWFENRYPGYDSVSPGMKLLEKF
jgi:hypothetical protein